MPCVSLSVVISDGTCILRVVYLCLEDMKFHLNLHRVNRQAWTNQPIYKLHFKYLKYLCAHKFVKLGVIKSSLFDTSCTLIALDRKKKGIMSTTAAEPKSSPGTKRKREDQEDVESPIHQDSTSTNGGGDHNKRSKVIGPTLPPADLEKPNRVEENDDDEDSSSDDDFGPALPPTESETTTTNHAENIEPLKKNAEFASDERDTKASTSQRDEWMLLPPGGDDWSSRVDPTKLRNRGFNTGRSSTAAARSGQSSGSSWTETTEEKRKRLEAEIMGIETASPSRGPTASTSANKDTDLEMSKRVQDYNVSFSLINLSFELKLITPNRRNEEILRCTRIINLNGRKMTRMTLALAHSTRRRTSECQQK